MMEEVKIQAVKTIKALLTKKADTKAVELYVKKPHGTLYWGGAGLDGEYVKPQIQAFINAGIKNVTYDLESSMTKMTAFIIPDEYKNTASLLGTLLDAANAGVSLRYAGSINYVQPILKGMGSHSEQFNLIGYSYGSLLAAHTAVFYATIEHHIINNLVLIASPIDKEFLDKLKSNKNIKNVIVIDLLEHGDLIYAGISQGELLRAALVLGEQMEAQKGEGHFYYAHVTKDSARRWKALAERLFNEGLR